MNRSADAHADRTLLAARQAADRRIAAATKLVWPLLVGTIMMVVGVLMRLPTAYYTGSHDQRSFNNYIFQFTGAYSDITSLYFRDKLWLHPVPYFGYYVEYPVGMGWLVWLINFVHHGVMPYFYATAAVMIICGLLVFWLGSAFDEANLWLLALSPTLPLYVVLNWDMFGILLTIGALLLFRRDRDGWGTLLLAAAVWTKFFPIVLVPLVVFERVLKGRWRDAITIGAGFGIVSVAINAPFALQITPQGWHIRDSWLHFFRFNQQRPREVNFWNFFDSLQLSVKEINLFSAILLALGVGAILLLMGYSWLRGAGKARDLLLPAALAAIGWFFFINKVYSPQYSLWLAVLMALLAAPPTLVVAFAAADIGYFTTSFVSLHLSSSQNPAARWFFADVMIPSMVFREAIILGIIGWALWRLLRPVASFDPDRTVRSG
ncbi:MAG TPA: hypothetical protein VFZ66_06850 [Herpetosiphonaceae bacterium]